MNISVIDNAGTPNDTSDDYSFTPFDLDVGEETQLGGEYYPCVKDNFEDTAPTDLIFEDLVTVQAASQIIGFEGVTVISSARCTVCNGTQC